MFQTSNKKTTLSISMVSAFILIISFSIKLLYCLAEKSYKNKAPNSFYKHHAANTENIICSQLGVKIMDEGGNAIDAAIASTICIGILNPFSSGIGGGGFMMVRKLKDQKQELEMFDFRETAPQNIDVKYFKAHPDDAKIGGMAVGVPGEVLGLYEGHKKHGKLPWKQLFKENIIIAKGFPATKILIDKLKKF